VGVTALVVDHGRNPWGWLGAALGFAIVMWATRRASRVVRASAWGVGVVVASVGALGSSASLGACGDIGALACGCAACFAVSRLEGEPGLARSEPVSPWPACAVVAVAWWTAAAVAVTAPPRWLGVEMQSCASALALTATTAAWAATLVWTRDKRRLDLSVVARARAMAVLLATIVVACALLALLGQVPLDVWARLTIAAAGAGLTAVAFARDAVHVERTVRRGAALAIVGGSVVLLGASAVQGRAGDPWLLTFSTGVIALALGALAERLDAPLRPAGGSWLDAFARAAEAAARPDPADALRDTLLALRAPLGLEHPSPALWTFDPSRVATVDAAGYLHERDAELPPELVSLAAGEPWGTIRSGVLGALEVRRPALRGAAAWMASQGAMSATLVAAGGESDGFLVLPHGARAADLTLEEVVDLKRVADRLATACRARGAEVRMLDRARDAALRADAAEETVERLRHQQSLESGRHMLAAARLARPATVGFYAAGSRMALEAIERRTAVGAPLAVVSPSGVDPVPYLARAHLSGARRQGPFVVVDATTVREHDPARWVDPETSPLALADGGLLVLLDGAVLPADVQRLIARVCAEARAPWERPERLDLQLALTGSSSPDDLVGAGRLDPQLAARLSDASGSPIVLPRLHERAEDFRSILTDRLAREGLRALGRPIGIEPAAFARLAEYTFPGEEAELLAIVVRLVARCQGDCVRASDVDALRALPKTPVESRAPRGRKDPLSA